MSILQKFYRSTVYILACIIVLRLSDSSSITNLTTILIMTDQHPEYKKSETSTPVKVQNNGQLYGQSMQKKWTENILQQ